MSNVGALIMPTATELVAALRMSQDPDAMVLVQLAEQGSDLSKAHEPEFVFDVAARADAEAIARALSAGDFEVRLYEPDSDNADYQLVAVRLMVLDLQALNELSQEFEALAKEHSASFDGWGAEVVE
jgi:Regulator of ribonuclease activity B